MYKPRLWFGSGGRVPWKCPVSPRPIGWLVLRGIGDLLHGLSQFNVDPRLATGGLSLGLGFITVGGAPKFPPHPPMNQRFFAFFWGVDMNQQLAAKCGFRGPLSASMTRGFHGGSACELHISPRCL